MTNWLKQTWNWIAGRSLWIVAIGLMVASSGIDGTYMEKLNAWMWFGYVLNTMSDVASVTIMYWYGRLQQDRSQTKRKRSKSLLACEIMSIAYSWLFSWRQLRLPVYQAESSPLIRSELGSTVEVEVLAFLFAGFIPLMLAGVGYTQALIAGRIEEERTESEHVAESQPKEEQVTLYACDRCDYVAINQHALNAHQRAHSNGSKPEREVIASVQ